MKQRIGIIGGGQLGRMLGFSAKQMGFTVTVVDPTPKSPASQVVDRQIIAGYSDAKATQELAKTSDIVTIEIEHINTSALANVAKQNITVHPSPKTIELIKDKLAQKRFLQKFHIPVAPFHSLEKVSIDHVAKQVGYPFLLKKRYGAYDGRGNFLVKKKSDIAKAIEKLGEENLYIEKYISFVKELAVMVARSQKGEIVTFPVVETIHKNNICHIVIAPAPVNDRIKKKAEILAKKVMKHLMGAGVFGIEMFLDDKETVLVNEIAPRVHNSGHYTIEACYTSQFEQHIRAIAGLPLGNSSMKVPAAVMINILGGKTKRDGIQGLHKALSIPNTAVHLYGKLDSKPERKMGHITVVGNSIEECLKKAIQARKRIII